MSDISRDLSHAVVRIAGRQAQCDPANRLQQLKDDVADLPAAVQNSVTTLVLLAGSAAEDVVAMREHRASRTERYVLLGVGVAFLLMLLWLAIDIPNPTASQEKTFTIVLGLAAAAFGSMLPGALAVEGQDPSLTVKATGAVGLAIFIILVYKFLL